MEGSFKIKDTAVDTIVRHWSAEEAKILGVINSRMNSAIALVYATARKRRSNVFLTGRYHKDLKTGRVTSSIRRLLTKKQIKSNSAARKVSDPRAAFGVPVATGRLRAGIEKDVDKRKYSIRGRVYSTEKYGQWLEYGTSRMQARPFMRPAFNVNKRHIRHLFATKIN